MLTLTAFGLLLDVPETTGDVRIVRVGMLVGMLTLLVVSALAPASATWPVQVQRIRYATFRMPITVRERERM